MVPSLKVMKRSEDAWLAIFHALGRIPLPDEPTPVDALGCIGMEKGQLTALFGNWRARGPSRSFEAAKKTYEEAQRSEDASVEELRASGDSSFCHERSPLLVNLAERTPETRRLEEEMIAKLTLLGTSDDRVDFGDETEAEQIPFPADFSDAREAVNNFSTVFDRYRTSGRHVSPFFFVGGLHDALKEAFDPPGRGASDKKPLAIYLHHDRSIAADVFPSKVLCSESVCSLLRHQFVMWPWDVTQAENKDKLDEWLTMCNLEHVSQILSMRTLTYDAYPVLLLLIKEKGVTTLADMCFGTDTVEAVVVKIMSAVDDMVEERERVETDGIPQEQALECEMSLAADRARVEQKEREIREQQEAEENRRREEEEERMMRQLLASELPEEPSATEPGVVHVKFRMPGGEQLMRRFRSSEKLSVLLTFLSSKGFSSDKFKYFNSDFPKKEVTGMDASSTFGNLKWPTREQVFVEEI